MESLSGAALVAARQWLPGARRPASGAAKQRSQYILADCAAQYEMPAGNVPAAAPARLPSPAKP
jgi:hypothetical protein